MAPTFKQRLAEPPVPESTDSAALHLKGPHAGGALSMRTHPPTGYAVPTPTMKAAHTLWQGRGMAFLKGLEGRKEVDLMGWAGGRRGKCRTSIRNMISKSLKLGRPR